MPGSTGVQLRGSNYTPRNVGRFSAAGRDGADVHIHGGGEKSSGTIFFPSGTQGQSHLHPAPVGLIGRNAPLLIKHSVNY